MLRNDRSMRGQTPDVLRIIFLLVVCALILGCSHYPYPIDWSKIRESSNNECINISGEYSDLDTENVLDTRRHSLAKWLLKLKDDIKYDTQTSYIDIVQSDKIVEVKLKKNNQETIKEEKLIIGKDIVCKKDGFHISENSFWAHPLYLAIAFQREDYTLLTSEDGSLVVRAEEAYFGVVSIIIPFAKSESKYHRFERWRYK